MNLNKIKKSWAVRYLVFFYFMAGLAMMGLKWYSELHYSEEARKKLTEENSRFVNMTENPCKHQIRGEPTDSGNDYVKIHIECKNSATDNTLSLLSITDRRWENVIRTLANVNMFTLKGFNHSDGNFKCFRDGVEITYSDLIENRNQINCYEKY